jgi:sulfur dioxygenase
MKETPENATRALPEAPAHPAGFFEARPSDVGGRGDLLLLDVRQPAELTDELGHIHGVRHIPMAELLANGLADVPVDTPVVVICRSGGRSATCAQHLVSQRGFRDVYNLVGGMIRWNAEGYPVARTPTWK